MLCTGVWRVSEFFNKNSPAQLTVIEQVCHLIVQRLNVLRCIKFFSQVLCSESAIPLLSAYCYKKLYFSSHCESDSNGGSSDNEQTQLIEQMNATINNQQVIIALLQNQFAEMNETIKNLQLTASKQQTTIDNHNTTISNHGTSISTHESEINKLPTKDGSY